MASSVITVPGFSIGQEGVCHFFGTRRAPVLNSFPGAATVGDETVPGTPAVIISVKQVHGTEILTLDRPVRGSERFEDGCDALITNQRGVLLTVRTADCVPVLIADPMHQIVAAVHAGWRGTVADIVSKTILEMTKRFGSDPRAIRAAIGPSIGPCCYEVDVPVLDRVRSMGIEWQKAVKDRGPGKAMLDLRQLVRIQLHAAGVMPESVQSVDLCTACHPDLFYSYRREGAVLATMISGIMLHQKASQKSSS
jgi:YfiH family protein